MTPFLCRMGRSCHRDRIQYVTRGEINKLLGQRQMLPTHRGRVQTLFKDRLAQNSGSIYKLKDGVVFRPV